MDSWNDTPALEAIEAFIERADRVAPEQRVAVFDNDGTLWSEKPMPIQLDFTLRKLAEMAEADGSLRDRQPWKAAYERDYEWLGAAMVKHYGGDEGDLKLLLGAIGEAFGGMDVERYATDVRSFFAEADHPVLGRPYRDCAFQPMVELLRRLEEAGASTFIASGGDRDFMRPIAGPMYGIPPERVIGSSFFLDYSEREGEGVVSYKSDIDYFDDGPVKPMRIWSRIGRRPSVAVGNSNGDLPMLRFASPDGLAPLRVLILHDDAEREFDYVDGAEDALGMADELGITVVSVKDDWSTVFAEG